MTTSCCKPIGGYFELELAKGDQAYHDSPLAFKSGRSSLQFLLETLRPSLVYVPFYTCDGLLEPFLNTKVPYVFYEIDELLEPKNLPVIKENEFFLYINYFDLKRKTVGKLSEHYKQHFIADCTLAYFAKGNGRSWFFNSCRKFFGVPDGSFLYAPATMPMHPEVHQNEEYTVDHLLKRFNGQTSEGYTSFVQNEQLCGGPVGRMSKLTEHLLSQVDHASVSEKRRSNYQFLHGLLADINKLDLAADKDSVPMLYPLLLDHAIDKKHLYKKNIFAPTYWTDVLRRTGDGFAFERYLTENLLPLPIDHRYGQEHMVCMVNTLKQLL
jgi:hypothetical protein